jgi:D-galactose 1-dehydrogenase
MPYAIAVIGLGKIAQDQHLPVIAKNPEFKLAATVSQRGLAESGVPSFRTAEELYRSGTAVDCVAICTPPHVRFGMAKQALDAGMHVLLEKPPFPTTLELVEITRHADEKKRVIFTTWHSQYNAAVEDTRRCLAGKKLRRLSITWKEDVRRWHPGQEWIWQQGGFGVFDPGINALSILSRIMPDAVFVRSAELTYPSNKDMPIAAKLTFTSGAEADDAGSALTADFDWRQQGDQSWNFAIETADGTKLDLTNGGSRLAVNGEVVVDERPEEYEKIYARFATLLAKGESLVDATPFQLVADAFMVGRRRVTDAFQD